MATQKTATKKANSRKQTPAKKATTRKKPTKSAGKKMSAIDAAAMVLGESKQPLNTKEMVENMATKGYWSSPCGKTPHATLYSAILRDIQKNGDASRFRKVERGKFASR